MRLTRSVRFGGLALVKVSASPGGLALVKVSASPGGLALVKVSASPGGLALVKVSASPGELLNICFKFPCRFCCEPVVGDECVVVPWCLGITFDHVPEELAVHGEVLPWASWVCGTSAFPGLEVGLWIEPRPSALALQTRSSTVVETTRSFGSFHAFRRTVGSRNTHSTNPVLESLSEEPWCEQLLSTPEP
ncbi:hypothetical protein Cadr_000023535 [Camelus dromedarius]|uniref:Uncharacterized protein n=1 Tax=Camelus dromedarius TaxID=9838 RepID=A0A5N4CW82_CAMDR|nr:hypothetical protein Cadr_000023535 [Camelus dromedarius]